jgi:phosphoglycerate dehydrogenase-like enzyme
MCMCVCLCVCSQDGAADQVLPSGSPASLSTLLAESDFLVLTCPLSDETEGLIGTAELQAMKPSATLVNCARGAVVVEDELIAAPQAGEIAAVRPPTPPPPPTHTHTNSPT